jgi:hypothetical protein
MTGSELFTVIRNLLLNDKLPQYNNVFAYSEKLPKVGSVIETCHNGSDTG